MAKGRPDFSPTAVDVILRPEWAAQEGTDKQFLAEDVKTYRQLVETIYTVPAGRKLIITDLIGRAFATAAANADLNQIMEITCFTDTTELVIVGGNGGLAVTLSKPLVILAGALFSLRTYCNANHEMNVAALASGYEYVV
mgnify:CR=1 FL=1